MIFAQNRRGNHDEDALKMYARADVLAKNDLEKAKVKEMLSHFE